MPNKEYWDLAHSKQDKGALTGTPWLQVSRLFELPFSLNSKKILCVGIGTGSWVRELAGTGAIVDVLDISEKAFDCVRNIARRCYLADQLDSLVSNEYDYAISLWVAPHMSDVELYEQLREVIRSLKATGIYAIHYNEPLNWLSDKDPIPNREEDKAPAGRMVRTRERFMQMLDKAKGRIVKYTHTDFSYKWFIKIACCHIERRP